VDSELRVQIVARRGPEVRRKVFRHYLPPDRTLSEFFDEFVAEIDAILDDILRR